MSRSYWQSRRRLRIEDAIQQAVIDTWRWLGNQDTLVACIPNRFALGQPGLTPGLPDLLVLGPRVPNGIGFIELKRDEAAPVSDAQQDFHDLCARLGIACKVTRGRDEPIKLLELWGVVKSGVDERAAGGKARVAAK